MRLKSTKPVSGAIDYRDKAYKPRPGYAVLEGGNHTEQNFLVVPVPLLTRLTSKHVGAGLAVSFSTAVRQGLVVETDIDGHVHYEGAPIIDDHIA